MKQLHRHTPIPNTQTIRYPHGGIQTCLLSKWSYKVTLLRNSPEAQQRHHGKDVLSHHRQRRVKIYCHTPLVWLTPKIALEISLENGIPLILLLLERAVRKGGGGVNWDWVLVIMFYRIYFIHLFFHWPHHHTWLNVCNNADELNIPFTFMHTVYSSTATRLKTLSVLLKYWTIYNRRKGIILNTYCVSACKAFWNTLRLHRGHN